MATKTVHVCDRCSAEQATALAAVTVSVRGVGSQETRDLCPSCMQALQWFFASPDATEAAPVVSIARRKAGR